MALSFRRFPLLRVFILLAISLSALSSVPALAADAVQMVVESPFARTAKPLSVQASFGRWFPLAITLSNSGEPVSGRLTLRLSKHATNEGKPLLSSFTDVDLPTNANKRIWLYGELDSEQWTGAEVRFEGRGIRALTAPVALEYTDAGTRLLLTISDSDVRYGFLSSFRNPRLKAVADLADSTRPPGTPYYNPNYPSYGGSSPTAANAPAPLRPLQASHALIPDRWIGLEAADAVILQDFSHTSLTPAQVAALRGYVAGGGTLVVAAGADWQRLANSPLADLWPVTPSTSGPATATETNEIVARYLGSSGLSGADRLGGAPVLLTRGTLKPGTRRLAESGSTALLSTRLEGAGRVVWMAMDPAQPPFTGWRGQEPLWIELTAQMKRPPHFENIDPQRRTDYEYYGWDSPQYGQSQMAEYVRLIRNLPQLQMPPTSVIAWFLALYVFLLVPVNYFILRLIDRREWAWITVPAIAIIFSIASYLAARSIKGTDLLRRHMTIVQGSGDSRLARADSLLWIRSPRSGYYTVASSEPSVALTDYKAMEFERSPVETAVRQDDPTKSFRVEDVSVPMWSEAQFVGEGTLATGSGITVQTGTDSRPASVRNGTPWNWKGAVIVSGGEIWSCGDGSVNAGATATLKRADAIKNASPNLIGRVENVANFTALFDSGDITVRDTTLRDLAHQALTTVLVKDARRAKEAPYLIAWSRDALAPIELQDEEPGTQNVSLLAFRLRPFPVSTTRPIELTAVDVSRAYVTSQSSDAPPTKAFFECDLGAANSAAPVRLALVVDGPVSGGLVPPPGSMAPPGGLSMPQPGKPKNNGYSPAKEKARLSKTLKFDLWDFNDRKWVSQEGTFIPPARPDNNWIFQSQLSPAQIRVAVRRPDGLIRLRITGGKEGLSVRNVKWKAN